MTVLTTPRTTIRELTAADAAFINDLLNQPSFMQFIGDRHVRSDSDGAAFITTRYQPSYAMNGYGLWAVVMTETGEATGICGFVKRDAFPDPDLGFAFLPKYVGLGLASEAARAVMHYGRDVLNLTRVLAIVQPDNARSITLLAGLGFEFVNITPSPTDATETLHLYASDV